MIGDKHVVARVEFHAVAIPRAGLCLNEATDRWLAASPDNKVLDDGGRGDTRLLVASDRARTVIYEVLDTTFEHAMAHMRAAGFDVRGQGTASFDGNPTIVVSEKY